MTDEINREHNAVNKAAENETLERKESEMTDEERIQKRAPRRAVFVLVASL